MKKMLCCLALFGICTLSLAGCGGSSEPTIVEPVGGGPTMAAEDQKSYEEQMKSGGSGSAKPGN
jgi:hypothetical protein